MDVEEKIKDLNSIKVMDLLTKRDSEILEINLEKYSRHQWELRRYEILKRTDLDAIRNELNQKSILHLAT